MSERCGDHQKFEERLFTAIGDMARTRGAMERLEEKIDSSIKSIESHIKSGGTWRGIIATVAVSVIMQALLFAYMYGQLCNTVQSNSREIQSLEELHPRAAK